MSVQSEIDRIITAVGNAYSKVSEKGGTVPASQTVANLATAIDSIPAGGAKETWVLNESLSSSNAKYTIDFTSNGTRYSKLTVSPLVSARLKYGDILVYGKRPGGASSGWIDQAYRKLTFDSPPTGSLLTWLQKNGVKQPDDTAVQDTKALTITSNGTVSVTPDVPYDVLKKVDVTVNVASGGGTSTVTFTKNGAGADIYYLDLDGVWRHEYTIEIVTTITIRPYSPFLLGSMYITYGLSDVNNIEEAPFDGSIIANNNTTKIYYATASIASATLPAD